MLAGAKRKDANNWPRQIVTIASGTEGIMNKELELIEEWKQIDKEKDVIIENIQREHVNMEEADGAIAQAYNEISTAEKMIMESRRRINEAEIEKDLLEDKIDEIREKLEELKNE